MTRLLIIIFFSIFAISAFAKNIEMPSVISITACEVQNNGPEDQNAEYTHVENNKWYVDDTGKLHCMNRKIEVADGDAALGADPKPFNQQECERSALMMSTEINRQFASKNLNYRVWRIACPTPVMDTETGDIVDWKIPGCGHLDLVVCDANL